MAKAPKTPPGRALARFCSEEIAAVRKAQADRNVRAGGFYAAVARDPGRYGRVAAIYANSDADEQFEIRLRELNDLLKLVPLVDSGGMSIAEAMLSAGVEKARARSILSFGRACEAVQKKREAFIEGEVSRRPKWMGDGRPPDSEFGKSSLNHLIRDATHAAEKLYPMPELAE